ncbi:glycosyltransferase family 4 protein [Enterobacter hormaechei]|uniref:Glycosyl transferase n=2 Tax=Enterobacter cloacae complex TaxID=354276 RepID=A0A6B9XZV8_ENTCL|nr:MULTISPECIES: glycosyltransferase [Enterobacter cloacae complex]EKS6533943.1 glycosyltransferase [Enterobacter hormaechei]MBH4408824.1 glycosyltransferase [Pseudomonas aeruginosa]QHR93129.1 glycosyl transferase [Enterobacter cloacae]EKS6537920.1 glycosyltransferase [Enterobacter hormaechei]EKS6546240.1 glycosyltransferase [Enterobacter hormaechei]
MSIGLYCNWKVKICGSGGFYVNNVHARYISAFIKRFGKVYLLSNLSFDSPEQSDTLFNDDSIELIPLPAFKNYFSSIRYFWCITKGVKELCNKAELIYIRTPEPLCWLFTLFKRNNIINHHFTSNPLEVILNQSSSTVLKKYVKYCMFLPEYYLSACSAYINNASCNGPSVVKNSPFFLQEKLKVLIENTVTVKELDEKNYFERNLDGKIELLCVCRLQEGKGLIELIDAFSNFITRSKAFNFHLSIIGDGPLRNSLQGRVDEQKLSSFITLNGYVKNGEELNAFYRKAHILINPSFSETGPRVILEAMAEGCVCLSTDVGYVRYIYKNEPSFNNLIMNVNFQDEFDEKLKAIINSQEVYDNLSRKSFALAKRYSLDSFVNNIF